MLTPKQRTILEGKNFYTVSTIGRDGAPRSTTIWGDLEGEDITVNTSEGRGWLANLRRDPRVAVAVHDVADPYNQVSLRGRAVELTNEGAQDHIDALSRKYTGQDFGLRPGHTRVKIRIAIDHARSWGTDPHLSAPSRGGNCYDSPRLAAPPFLPPWPPLARPPSPPPLVAGWVAPGLGFIVWVPARKTWPPGPLTIPVGVEYQRR